MLSFTITQAAEHWNIARETLRKRFVAAGITADNGTYTLQQINNAVFGDKHAQALRKVTAEADRVAIDNAKELEQVMILDEFLKLDDIKTAEIKQFISTTIQDDTLRDKILNGIADIYTPKS